MLKIVIKKYKNRPWLGSSVGWSVVPLRQVCGFDLWAGHMQEATNECMNTWNNKSMSPSFLSLPRPYSSSLSKVNFVFMYKDFFMYRDLLRASELMEMTFGLDVKEVAPTNHYYGLPLKMDLTYEGTLHGEKHVHHTGILTLILGVIFTKENRATKEEVWKVLNGWGYKVGGSTSSLESPGNSPPEMS